MSDNPDPNLLLSAALPAIADELSDLALEIAVLGENLSAAGCTAEGMRSMQKFDAFSQALNAYATVLRGLTDGRTLVSPFAVADLIDAVPFFDVRERIRSKLFSMALPDVMEGHCDEMWFEC